jgi:hypothetical protein
MKKSALDLAAEWIKKQPCDNCPLGKSWDKWSNGRQTKPDCSGKRPDCFKTIKKHFQTKTKEEK